MDAAATTYQAIDERYTGRGGSELVGFALRRKVAGQGWDAKYQPMIDAIFPRGVEKTSLAAVGQTPPSNGACFTHMSEQLRETGLGLKDVVVGLDGVRVDTLEQYIAARSLSDSPDMLFLLWDGQGTPR